MVDGQLLVLSRMVLVVPGPVMPEFTPELTIISVGLIRMWLMVGVAHHLQQQHLHLQQQDLPVI